MKNRNKIVCLPILVLGALLVFSSAPAKVQAVDSFFDVFVELSVDTGYGDGNGFNNGSWYYYPNTGWLNQWFYNAPYDPDRWKVIDLWLDYNAIDPAQPSYVEIAYNWSTPEWSALGMDAPPLPQDVPTLAEEEVLIARYNFFEAWPSSGGHVEDHFVIPDYNPEWVSIDVRGYNFEIVNGRMIHECVPEPSTLLLLGSGVLGLVGYARRRSHK